MALGFVYVMTTPPSFTATTTMMIDAKRVQLFQQSSMINDLPIDAATVESQIEVLKSETIAQAVIDKLHLVNDPEFAGSGGGLFGTLLNMVTSLFSSGETAGDTNSDFGLKRAAVGTFQHNLTIRRVGLTYVVNISFQSLSPVRAAQIANAVANAYIDDQLESKFESARRAGTWLQGRLRELRDQASTAERAVVAFKNKHDMVDTGGRTINEQQLAELNSELVVARSKTAEARARLDRVQAVLHNNSLDATVAETVADTLKNEVITKLRSKYLELARREADWTLRYGAVTSPSSMSVTRCTKSKIQFATSCNALPRPIRATWKLRSNKKIACKSSSTGQLRNPRSLTRRKSPCASLKAMRKRIAHSTTISCSDIWSRSSSNRSQSLKPG